VTGGDVPRGIEQDERLQRYLLGQLSDEERDHLEGEYLVNSELHDQLVAVEDELIYAYVGGRLSPSQAISFERFFLQTPERRSRVEFARSFAQFLEANPGLQGTTTVSRWDERSALGPELGQDRPPDTRERPAARPIWNSFWTNAVAWGKNPIVRLAFATLIVAISLVSFLRTRSTGHPGLGQNKSDAVVKYGQPSTLTQFPASPSSPAERGSHKAPKILAFTLVASERNSGQGNLLTIPQGDYVVGLWLQPFDDIYPNYRATLSTPEQRTVARGQVQGKPPEQPYVEFASKFLGSGDYILHLYGVSGPSPSGKSEEVEAYALRVVREQPK
jgi:hypothetical protein